MLSGVENTTFDNLIRVMCFINNIPMITIIGMSVTHLFISAKCVKRLNLEVSTMSGGMVIDTSTMRLVTTTLVFLKCPLIIFGRDYGMDSVCLPLMQIYVILGINWLDFNHGHINCYAKTVSSQSWLKMKIYLYWLKK